jgi:hypothetical protein
MLAYPLDADGVSDGEPSNRSALSGREQLRRWLKDDAIHIGPAKDGSLVAAVAPRLAPPGGSSRERSATHIAAGSAAVAARVVPSRQAACAVAQ